MNAKAPQPPYQTNNKTEPSKFWKTEHSINYSPLKSRKKNEITNKSLIRKIQITFPFSFSKL